MDVDLNGTPASLGFAMPAEWARHERSFLAWPCRRELWGDAARMQRAKAATARLARAIAEVERVAMIARPEDGAEAERQCGKGVEVIALPIDDSWVRDSGPIFVRRGSEIAGVDFAFNGWGEKYHPFKRDDELPARLLSRLGLRRFASAMVLEGGSVAVDGAGVLMTTDECLMSPNRNPGLSRGEIENELRAFLGVRDIVWLPFGLEDDETDGHIDNVAAFAAPDLVLMNWTEDETDGNRARMIANERALVQAGERLGRRFEIIKLPQPKRESGWHGTRLPRSYINFYVANGTVFAPCFDDPMDKEAARILGECFQSRDVVQVPMDDIVGGGGGIHCITQQQPASERVR